ncbi:MAG TPA: hypothetical protein VMG82_02780 [Candidatus Sulfotelmatobacter sp.]|nr:hypothetical protein [Candidatus Sulfotelmatobacter sp.]
MSDESYSIWPYISLDEATPRLHSVLNFSPGFTFYQHTNDRDEADENVALNFSYRFSPHVTLSLVDSLRKSSTLVNQANLFGNPAFGAGQVSPVTVLAPVADQLSNAGTAQLSYQFGPNAMVGMSGTFSNLHYSNSAEVPGLYDSGSRGGSIFYTHRLSGRHYVGATYQYQDLLAYPTGFRAETQTHAVTVFYTLYVTHAFSLSMFGGPQYSNSNASIFPAVHTWSPTTGASLSWQGQRTNLALTYSHIIAPGGGLIGAVHEDAGGLSLRRQLSASMSGGVQLSYANNKLLDPILASQFGGYATNGHTIAGTASIQRQLGAHFALGLNYSRLHQNYSNIAAIAGAPDTNMGTISISYQFAKPLGR